MTTIAKIKEAAFWHIPICLSCGEAGEEGDRGECSECGEEALVDGRTLLHYLEGVLAEEEEGN